MNRLERRLLRLNEQIALLRQEERLVAGELDMHRHLDEDARRDAAVYENPVERANARDTSADVARFQRGLAGLRRKLTDLESKRERLLERLGDD